jgi:Tfp pilus assembly protein PilO
MSGARTRIIVAGVVAALLAIGFFMLFVKPKQGELGAVKKQIEAEENRTLELNSQLAQLKALQKDAPKLEARLQQIRQFVPPTNEVSNFIFQVNDAAVLAGIDFAQVTPALPVTPPEGAQVVQTRVTIGATGSYFALQDFMRRLYALDRAVRVDGVDLSGGVDETTDALTVTATMTARIFFELPAGTAAPAAETAPGTEAAAPATPEES